MRAIVQRVRRASVAVRAPDGGTETVGQIGVGLCVLVGVTHTDTIDHACRMGDKLVRLRIFPDDADKMNRSLVDAAGDMLVVSQFTLYGDARRGNRPSFVEAARPDVAEPLIESMVEHIRAGGVKVETGRFRTDMDVELVNWGPVTLNLEL